jgi:hypothetical protein
MDADEEFQVAAPPPAPPSRFAQQAMRILWPSFLMAGVLEMLVFVVIDPADMRWFGGPAIEWSRQAIYTVTFLIFWWIISLAGALTALLERAPADLNEPGARRHWP